jgi:hypothetical protein
VNRRRRAGPKAGSPSACRGGARGAQSVHKAGTLGLSLCPLPCCQVGNVFEGNLGFATLVSNALLNTDTTPATFWATHPNNTYRNNIAAGKWGIPSAACFVHAHPCA